MQSDVPENEAPSPCVPLSHHTCLSACVRGRSVRVSPGHISPCLSGWFLCCSVLYSASTETQKVFWGLISQSIPAKSPGLVPHRGVGAAWQHRRVLWGAPRGREALPHGIQLFGRWLGVREERRWGEDPRLERQKVAKVKWREIHKMVRGLEHLSQAEGAGLVQPGDNEAPGRPHRGLPVLEGRL